MLNPKKILVVDDDKEILEVVELILSNAGFDVSTHTAGRGVLEKVSNTHPNLILLDIMLPGKTGIAVCKELKEEFSIPILLFSAHAKEGMSYKECRADGFIRKPFDLKALISAINSHLE